MKSNRARNVARSQRIMEKDDTDSAYVESGCSSQTDSTSVDSACSSQTECITVESGCSSQEMEVVRLVCIDQTA